MGGDAPEFFILNPETNLKIISSGFFYVNYFVYISSILMEVTTSLIKNNYDQVNPKIKSS